MDWLDNEQLDDEGMEDMFRDDLGEFDDDYELLAAPETMVKVGK